MKKIFIPLLCIFIYACSDHQSAESKPTDLDNTDNDDTSAKKRDGANNNRQDTTAILHKIQE